MYAEIMECILLWFYPLLAFYAAAKARGRKLSALLTTDSFYPAKGGGDLSLRILARGLAERGHDISVAYFGRDNDPEFKSHAIHYSSPIRGFWPRHMIVRAALKSELRKLLASTRPDVVITQQIALSPTVDACREFGVPVIVLLRGVDFLCLGSYWSGTERRCDYRCIGCGDVDHRLIQFPFFRMELPMIHDSLRHADAVISNSEYTRRTFMDILRVDSKVLNPPLESCSGGQTARESGNILFVSPVKHKGVDTAIELSRSLSAEQFMFVGDARHAMVRRLAGLKNVRYVKWVQDMSRCYLSAKMVIVPSVIPEGYGRVCAEAMSYGTPCVVSAVGALPEVVSDAGDIVHASRDISEWVRVINKYSDPAYVRMKSERALSRSSRFMTKESYAASVESIIWTLVSRVGNGSSGDFVDDSQTLGSEPTGIMVHHREVS